MDFKRLLFVLLILCYYTTLPAQNVAINTDGSAPHPSAILDIKSGTKGLLIPRTSTASRTAIVNGPNGLMLYDSSIGSFWFQHGGLWIEAGRIDVPNNNAFFGYQSGKALPTGDFNSGFGAEALFSNTNGIGNTSVGNGSMHSNNTGSYNTASGMFSLYFNTTGSSNTAIGNNSLLLNQTGYSNVAVGSGSLFSNTTGHNVVAVGDSALFNSSTSSFNTAIGNTAGFFNTTGTYNSFFGEQAGLSNTTGSGNSYFGEQAGDNNTTGSYNTMLGGAARPINVDLTHATAVGYGAQVGCSHCMVVGGPPIFGHEVFVGINNIQPSTDLHIVQLADVSLNNTRGIRLQRSNGGNQWRTFIDPSNNYIFQYNNNLYSYIEPVSATYVTSSDERLKTGLSPLPGVLDKLLLLQPKTYQYIATKDAGRHSYGFLAQDVEKLFPDFVFSSENGIKGIAYHNFSVIAIKAVQEQQEIIKTLQQNNEEQKQKIDQQQHQINEILKELKELRQQIEK